MTTARTTTTTTRTSEGRQNPIAASGIVYQLLKDGAAVSGVTPTNSNSKTLIIRSYIEAEGKRLAVKKTSYLKDCISQIVIIPSTLEIIGDGALAHSETFRQILFQRPSTLRQIQSSAFEGSNLEEIWIPRTVTTIGNRSFSDCEKLKSIRFEKQSELSSIGEAAFRGSYINEMEIPASVESIGQQCFKECIELQTVTFEPNSRLTAFSENMFQNCPIHRVQVPASVTYIGGGCFYDSDHLEQLVFEDENSVQDMGPFAFAHTGFPYQKLPKRLRKCCERDEETHRSMLSNTGTLAAFLSGFGPGFGPGFGSGFGFRW
jgi:hypothetical protein